MSKEPKSLDELMGEYDAERIAEIERWEKEKPAWVKEKIEAEKKRDIELGIRDADGYLIVPDETDDEEDEEEESE
jgi:hypothetical protein